MSAWVPARSFVTPPSPAVAARAVRSAVGAVAPKWRDAVTCGFAKAQQPSRARSSLVFTSMWTRRNEDKLPASGAARALARSLRAPECLLDPEPVDTR